MRMVLAFTALLVISGCVGVAPQTVEQRFYAALSAYQIGVEQAAIYVTSAHLCSDSDVVGCVPDDVAIAIDDVVTEYTPAVSAMATLFESETATPADRQAALRLARMALRQLTAASGDAL